MQSLPPFKNGRGASDYNQDIVVDFTAQQLIKPHTQDEVDYERWERARDLAIDMLVDCSAVVVVHGLGFGKQHLEVTALRFVPPAGGQ